MEQISEMTRVEFSRIAFCVKKKRGQESGRWGISEGSMLRGDGAEPMLVVVWIGTICELLDTP